MEGITFAIKQVNKGLKDLANLVREVSIEPGAAGNNLVILNRYKSLTTEGFKKLTFDVHETLNELVIILIDKEFSEEDEHYEIDSTPIIEKFKYIHPSDVKGVLQRIFSAVMATNDYVFNHSDDDRTTYTRLVTMISYYEVLEDLVYKIYEIGEEECATDVYREAMTNLIEGNFGEEEEDVCDNTN